MTEVLGFFHTTTHISETIGSSMGDMNEGGSTLDEVNLAITFVLIFFVRPTK